MKNWLADMSSGDKSIVLVGFAIATVVCVGIICTTIGNCVTSIHEGRIQQGVRGEQVQGGVRASTSSATN